MQLILDTEAALDIERDMSAVGDTENGKVSNCNNIEDLNKKFNINKENINNDADKNKTFCDEIETPKSSVDLEAVNNGMDSGYKEKEINAIATTNTCIENNEISNKNSFKPEEKDDEESQNNSTDTKINISIEVEHTKEEIKEEGSVKGAKEVPDKETNCIDIEFESNVQQNDNINQDKLEKNNIVDDDSMSIKKMTSCSKIDLMETDHEHNSIIEEVQHNQEKDELMKIDYEDLVPEKEVKDSSEKDESMEVNEDDSVSVPSQVQDCSGKVGIKKKGDKDDVLIAKDALDLFEKVDSIKLDKGNDSVSVTIEKPDCPDTYNSIKLDQDEDAVSLKENHPEADNSIAMNFENDPEALKVTTQDKKNCQVNKISCNKDNESVSNEESCNNITSQNITEVNDEDDIIEDDIISFRYETPLNAIEESHINEPEILEKESKDSVLEEQLLSGTDKFKEPEIPSPKCETKPTNETLKTSNKVASFINDEKPLECHDLKKMQRSEDFTNKIFQKDVIPIELSNQSETAPKETQDLYLEEELLNGKDEIEVIEEPRSSSTKSLTHLTPEPLEVTSIKAHSPENVNKQTEEKKSPVEQVKVSCDKVLEKDVPDSISIELGDDTEVEEIIEDPSKEQKNQEIDAPDKEILTEDKIKVNSPAKETPTVHDVIDKPVVCKLSNTLDILSDDEEEATALHAGAAPKPASPVISKPASPKELPETDCNNKQCIDLDDDDDIMVIDDTEKTNEPKPVDPSDKEDKIAKQVEDTDSETGEKTVQEADDLFAKKHEEESTPSVVDSSMDIDIDEKSAPSETLKDEPPKPFLPEDFLKTAKKSISDMTREDLEEFCILRIVESIVDRSSLSDIKNKLKTMAQGIEEYRKKALMLSKQNRDLQVVLKSVQEEQKKLTPGMPITPLKITRSVGMQVYMEKFGGRKKNIPPVQNNTNPNVRPRNIQISGQSPQRAPKIPISNQIPVPRLVPANNPAMKTPNQNVSANTPPKTAVVMPNGVRNPSPNLKPGEKRPHNKIMSVTVDLTDDEPPAKINNKSSPAPPVRLVSSQHLMLPPRQPFGPAVNSPRKVYIPISGQNQGGIRQTHAIMLKPVTTPGIRPRCPPPQMSRMPSNQVRVNRVPTSRHPAPLPDSTKQYQPPNWKALPPAPDLKLSKVENGIVISWKIEDYQEDSHEEIASYQLYAYQETASPPSTALWKKIGDVKALPLPMACTLTQFMPGFKYYFAVRAVDIRSRIGPFSLPGSILLLSKL